MLVTQVAITQFQPYFQAKYHNCSYYEILLLLTYRFQLWCRYHDQYVYLVIDHLILKFGRDDVKM